MKKEPLILDRYRLVERLAYGGSAEVWRGHDEQLDRAVAVKRLHAHLLPDEGSRKRLAAEARAAAGLSHPVIVDVYDVDVEGETPVIVMELVEGESLASRIASDGPLPASEAALVTAELAEALYHAHQRGVVHRDVKPGNVLLGPEGRTRLVDFGIARSLADATERLTLTGTVVGTLSAMAPEQLAGGPIGPRTDLYGLGVVLHEALTGRPPYAAGSLLALAEAQRAGPPPIDGVDPTLAALVAACLAPEPENRPLHAGAFATALRSWIAGDPSAAILMAPTAAHAAPVDTGAITQPIPVAPAPPAVAATGAGRGSDQRRRPWPLRLGAALAAVAAVGALVALSGLADDATGSLGATASPTLPPAWLEELVEDVEEACGSDGAADARLSMASMDEQAADDLASQLIDACEEAADDGGRGRGNRGDGNGNGHGGDD